MAFQSFGQELDLNPVQSWLNTPVTSKLTMDIIKRITPIWLGLAFLAFGLRIGYVTLSSTIEASISNTDKIPINYMDLLRGGFFVLLIGIYPQLFIGVSSFIRDTNNYSDPSTAAYTNMQKVSNQFFYDTQVDPYLDNINAAKEGYKEAVKGGDQEKIDASKVVLQEALADGVQADKLAKQKLDGTVDGKDITPNDMGGSASWLDYLNPLKIVGMILAALLSLIAMAIKLVIVFWAKMSFAIVGALGMIALTFGIWNPNIPSVWFGKVLNIGLSFTVLNILDQYITEFWVAVYNNGGLAGAADTVNLIGMNLGLIASYASVFTLTSWVVGGVGAGKLVSKSIGITSLFIAAAAAGVAMGIGGAGGGMMSGSSGMGNVAGGFVQGSRTLKDD